MQKAPYRYSRLTCRMFANPSGVNELDPSLTINGTTVEPTFRYKGGDADGTDFDPWGYGETLALQAGTAPTYNDGSPGLGVNDDSVKFNGGGYYKNATAVNQIGTEDFVIEFVCKGTDAYEFLMSTLDVDGYIVYLSTGGVGNVVLHLNDAGGNVTCGAAVNALSKDEWCHCMVFVNRDEASVNGSHWYINGVANGVGADVSAVSGTMASSSFSLGARGTGATPTTSSLAYAAMWKQSDWMQAGAAGPAEWAAIAASRFALFSGCGQANKANGTALASVKTRAFNAYLRKQEGANVKLYNVGSEWLRMESVDDSNGVNVKGYLAEPQITNLITESEDFSAWTKNDVGDVVADNVVECPDGRTAAASLVADATDGIHGVRLAATVTAHTYAYSVYAKPGNQDWIKLWNNTIAGVSCYFDIANGTVGTSGANATGYIEGPFNGGFYRCCIVFTGTAAAHTFHALSSEADGDFAFAGDGAAVNTYLWGAQVEKNDYMTSPILTDGATATQLKDQDRSVGDDGNITNNERGFMRFIVLAADCDRAADVALVTLSDGGAAADMITVTLAAAGDAATVTTAATAGNAGSATVAVDIADGDFHEIRVRWETDYLNIAVDGVWGTADTSVDPPDDLDRIDYGQNRSAASQAQCLISNLRIHSDTRGG